MSASQALAPLKSGMSVMIGGFFFSGCPFTLVQGLIDISDSVLKCNKKYIKRQENVKQNAVPSNSCEQESLCVKKRFNDTERNEYVAITCVVTRTLMYT